jgi:hypothetical protein
MKHATATILGLLLSSGAWAQAADCVTIQSSATIDAPYDIVWDTIVDFESYPSWNPYIVGTFPADPDVTVVGTQFTLVVFQPISQDTTFAPEIVTAVDPPDGDDALLAYAFDDPFAAAIGFPERVQAVERVRPFTSSYETEETFCGPLLPFLPLDDVQAGFDAQTAALAAEAQRRFQQSGPPCTNNGNGNGNGPGNNNGICNR